MASLAIEEQCSIVLKRKGHVRWETANQVASKGNIAEWETIA
jgi:hypothetical protein